MKIKERLAERLVKQSRKPEGFSGRVLGEYMGKIHEEVTKWGLTKINIMSEDIILDIGCGGGYTINKLAKQIINGKIYGIDYSEVMIKLAKETNYEFIEKGIVEIKYGIVSSLPFSKDTFNLILGVETVNFWPDIINDLKEILRVLKPNGTLILVNNSYKNKKFKKRNKKWKKLTNFNLYYPKQFEAFFMKAGFLNIQIFENKEKNWIIIKGNKSK